MDPTTETKRGDVFFVENHGLIGRFINWGQRLLSSDGQAKYNHVGVIRSDKGSPQTLEALKTVETHYLVEKYKGQNVLIARPLTCDKKKSLAIDKMVTADFGKKYPWYRFIYLIAPPLAKYIDSGASVCSELTAKYLYYAGVRHEFYQGTTPDRLVDEMRHWKNYEVIYEGVV